MATMHISTPEEMRDFVERQATKGGFSTASEYVRSILQEAQERERSREAIRGKLVEALESGPATPMIADDWEAIRTELDRRAESR